MYGGCALRNGCHQVNERQLLSCQGAILRTSTDYRLGITFDRAKQEDSRTHGVIVAESKPDDVVLCG